MDKGIEAGKRFVAREGRHPSPWSGRLWTVVSILSFIAVWEGIGRFILPTPYAFASFSRVARSTVEWFVRRDLLSHMGASAVEFSWGYLLATVVGIALGVIFARSPLVERFFGPWITILYTTPTVALAPVFVIVLGIGIASKVSIIFLAAVFPILMSTLVGIKSTEAPLIEAARAFGASEMRIFATVHLPHSIPFIVTGLRLGLSRGLVGIVVAELFGASKGIGFLIWFASQTIDPATLFMAVGILALVGLSLTSLFMLLEQRLAPWRQFREKDG